MIQEQPQACLSNRNRTAGAARLRQRRFERGVDMNAPAEAFRRYRAAGVTTLHVDPDGGRLVVG